VFVTNLLALPKFTITPYNQHLSIH